MHFFATLFYVLSKHISGCAEIAENLLMDPPCVFYRTKYQTQHQRSPDKLLEE